MDLVTIMDSVHGPIQLEKFLFKIIDTQEFQRLRKIKQFGGVYYVYPGGVHTRFEHSIGVCYIAGQLVDALNKHLPDESKTGLTKWFTDEEKMCVQIAALCHDIGHGPFSHVYDIAVEEYFRKLKSNEEKKAFIKQNSEDVDDEDIKLPKEARHEYRSALIVGQLLEKLPFEKLNEDHVKLIENMITFSEDYKDDPKKAEEKLVSGRIKKAYLYEIVANGFTGIDVDKMDYFARDSHSVGLPNSFDWRRFIQIAKIIECDDGFHHICSRDKDALSLYELFHTRNVLYRLVYKHKTVVIVEDLIKEALKKAKITIKVKDGRTYPLLQCWKNITAFHQINDSVENLIMTEIEIQHGQRQIMEVQEETDESPCRKCYNKIWERKLPKFLGRTTSKDSIGENDLIDAAKGKEGAQADKDKIREKIKCIDVKFSYGMGDKNPILLHYFYGKTCPEDSFQLKKEEVSSILPDNVEEKEVFWYYEQSQDDVEDEEIKKALWKRLNPSRLTIDEECM